jgi:hypothetical protein
MAVLMGSATDVLNNIWTIGNATVTGYKENFSIQTVQYIGRIMNTARTDALEEHADLLVLKDILILIDATETGNSNCIRIQIAA